MQKPAPAPESTFISPRVSRELTSLSERCSVDPLALVSHLAAIHRTEAADLRTAGAFPMR